MQTVIPRLAACADRLQKSADKLAAIVTDPRVSVAKVERRERGLARQRH